MVDYSKGKSPEELEPFFPNEILRHILLIFLLISALMLGVIFIPESFQKSTDEFAPLEQANHENSDRSRINAGGNLKTSSHPFREISLTEFAAIQTRPPWYLFPFYQLLNLIRNKGAYIAILTILGITFISIPFLDRNTERSLWKKPIFFSIIVINLSLIMLLGLIRFFQ